MKKRPQQVAWGPLSPSPVGALIVNKGQKLNWGIYLHILGEQLQTLLDREDYPKEQLELLAESMDKAGVGLQEGEPPLEEAGRYLVESNLNFREHLSQVLGIHHKIPSEPITKDHRTLKRKLREMTLCEWKENLIP